MGLTDLRGFLRRHKHLALDTSVFIYQLEANPKYVELTDYVFAWLEGVDRAAVTSTATMTELLVEPYRASDHDRVDQFYGLLTTYPNLSWIAPNLNIADIAARIRAEHRLRTPDALQVATAIQSKATGLVTNDSVFQRVKEIETFVLEHILE